MPPPTLTAPFDVPAFLKAAGVSARSRRFPPGAVVFAQGGEADCVFHLQRGRVKISVVSTTGKEAVIAMFGPGDFFGEGCLAGQARRMSTATAMTATSALCVPRADMMRA